MDRFYLKIVSFLPTVFKYFLFIFTFFFIIFLSKDNCIYYDDFIECFLSAEENIFSSLLPGINIHGGGYTSFFFTRFFTFWIPYFLDIHPANYVFKILPYIKAFLFVLFFQISVQFFLLRNYKNKWLFLFCLMFFISYVLYFLHLADFMCINDNITFFRYIISLFAYFYFSIFLYKLAVFKNIQIGFGQYIFILFSMIIVSTNLETLIFSTAFLLFLLVFYNIFLKLLFNKKFSLYEKYRFNLTYKFYFFMIIYYLFLFLYLKSPRYYANFNFRGFGDFNLTSNDLLVFFKQFYEFYIYQNISYWICLFLIILYVFFRKKNSLQVKKYSFAFFLLASTLCVYLSLFICGENSYIGTYWIRDPKLIIFFKFMMLLPLFIFVEELINLVSVYHKKYIIYFLSSLFIIHTVYFSYLIFNRIDYVPTSYTYKKTNYINEKMYRYFILNNVKPVLIKINPYPASQSWVPFPFLEILGEFPDYMNKKEICSYGNSRTSAYLNLVYNEKINNVTFCFTDDALDKFYDLGGFFSEQELSNIDFEKLKDPKFVLQTTKNTDEIISKDEIISIFKTFYD